MAQSSFIDKLLPFSQLIFKFVLLASCLGFIISLRYVQINVIVNENIGSDFFRCR
jgi:hypothetical protein